MSTSIYGQGAQTNLNASGFIRSESFTPGAGVQILNFSTFTYVVSSDALMVFLNGTKQQVGRDYTELSVSSIRFNEAFTSDDVVDVIGFGNITLIAGTGGGSGGTTILNETQYDLVTSTAAQSLLLAGDTFTPTQSKGFRVVGPDSTNIYGIDFFQQTLGGFLAFKFTGAFNLKHNSYAPGVVPPNQTFALPGSADIVTADGDVMFAFNDAVALSDGYFVWRILYFKANGTAVVGSGGGGGGAGPAGPIGPQGPAGPPGTSVTYTSTGTSTAYQISPSPAITAYAAGQTYNVKFHVTNTGASTLQASGIGSPPAIVKAVFNGSTLQLLPLEANDVPAGYVAVVTLISTAQALILNLPARTVNILPTLAATVASGALTATAKPTTLDFRSATLSSGAVNTITPASTLSLTVPSGATLGTTSGVLSKLCLIEVLNGSTPVLAIANVTAGLGVTEDQLISTNALTVGSTSSGVFYSAAAVSNCPFKILGFIESTQVTAGSWTVAPSKIYAATAFSAGVGSSSTAPQVTVHSWQTAHNQYQSFTIPAGCKKLVQVWDSVGVQCTTGTSTDVKVLIARLKAGASYPVASRSDLALGSGGVTPVTHASDGVSRNYFPVTSTLMTRSTVDPVSLKLEIDLSLPNCALIKSQGLQTFISGGSYDSVGYAFCINSEVYHTGLTFDKFTVRANDDSYGNPADFESNITYPPNVFNFTGTITTTFYF